MDVSFDASRAPFSAARSGKVRVIMTSGVSASVIGFAKAIMRSQNGGGTHLSG